MDLPTIIFIVVILGAAFCLLSPMAEVVTMLVVTMVTLVYYIKTLITMR
jgi:hypothetical protein